MTLMTLSRILHVVMASREHDFAEEFLFHLPKEAWSRRRHAPTGSSPYASYSLPLASNVNDNDGHDDAHAGGVSGNQKLEHADKHCVW